VTQTVASLPTPTAKGRSYRVHQDRFGESFCLLEHRKRGRRACVARTGLRLGGAECRIVIVFKASPRSVLLSAFGLWPKPEVHQHASDDPPQAVIVLMNWPGLRLKHCSIKRVERVQLINVRLLMSSSCWLRCQTNRTVNYPQPSIQQWH
jgi:hypothetical protein